MDGVLVDSEIHWRKTESVFLKQLIPHWNDELQSSILGMSLYDIHSHLVTAHGFALTRVEFVERYRDLSLRIYGEQSSLLPGVLELIKELRAEKFRLAVASSSPHAWIDIVLSRFSLQPYFDAVVSSDDVQARGKPHPDIYLATATKLGVPPDNCVAIEDSAKGVESAITAGMRCVGLRNGFNEHQDLARATIIIQTFAELTLERLRDLERGLAPS